MKSRMKRVAAWALVWSRVRRAAGWRPPEGMLYSVAIFPGAEGGPEVTAALSQCVVKAIVELSPGRPWREDLSRLERAARELTEEHEKFHASLGARVAAAGNLKGGDGC